MMRHLARLLGLLILTAVPCFAQTTAVSGVIEDASSQAFAYGSWTATLIGPPGYVGGFYLNGVLMGPTLTTLSGTLSSTGSISTTLTSNNVITISGGGQALSLWKFTVCPAATATCYSTSLSITGSTYSVTGNIVSPTITVNATPNVLPSAYSDSEISGATVGFSYWNITNGTIRTCSPPACTWLASSSSGGVGAGAAPLAPGYFALSSNCPTANTGNCYFTYGNTQVDQTCSYSSTSTTLTCSDGPFTTGDVTTPAKYVWGQASASTGGCDPFQASTAFVDPMTLTHLTITAYISSTQVTLSADPANTSSGNVCVIWGQPDDSGASALETAYDASLSCPHVFLAAGYYLFTSPHFTSQPTACAKSPNVYPNGTLEGNIYFDNGIEVEGRGVGTTIVYIPPDFSYSSCTNGVLGDGCFNIPVEGRYHDFGISAGAPIYGTNLHALITGSVGSLFNFRGTGWANGSGFTSGNGTRCIEANYWLRMWDNDISNCGTTGFYLAATTAQQHYMLVAENNYSSNFYDAGGLYQECFECVGYGTEDNVAMNIWYCTEVGNDSPMLYLKGGIIGAGNGSSGSGIVGVSNNSCDVDLDGIRFQTFGSSTNATDISASSPGSNAPVTVVRALFGLATNGSGHIYTDNSTATALLVDNCGNQFGTTPAVSVSGAIHGSCSNTTLLAASNVTASTGWGTSGAAGNGISFVNGNSSKGTFAITAAGTPTANPTVTVAFPQNFLATPFVCTGFIETGGGAPATLIVNSSSASSVTFKYSGTPVATTVYGIQFYCDNP